MNDDPVNNDTSEREEAITSLDNLARNANVLIQGLDDMLRHLPKSTARDSAGHYLATATLWIQQAFNDEKRKLTK
jgi:hypothetical protein